MNKQLAPEARNFLQFDRRMLDTYSGLTVFGKGSLGGKALGLAFIKETIESSFENNKFEKIHISIPNMAVICTDHFDVFMKQNDLYEIAYSDSADDAIARAFQKASLPPQIVGDLRSITTTIHNPLAVRSSSMLEDDMYEPFAGVYGTKMIPNNNPSPDVRFQKLMEAIKFVYASTFFKAAKSYIKAVGKSFKDEKMAVIIQDVVGLKHGGKYYPHISGVARSYNFYPTGNAEPEHGVVNLALGLGKTIVDNGISWNYSPAYPKSPVPFNSVNDIVKNTQSNFWAVNLEKLSQYNPTKESEFLIEGNIQQADEDNVLKWLASTYVPASDRIYPGIAYAGCRILNFAPILELDFIAVNSLIKELLRICEEKMETKVEIELAITIEDNSCDKVKLGFLQVRPMVVSDKLVEVKEDEWDCEELLLRSDKVMGNGTDNEIRNIVAVKPDVFKAKHTPEMVAELEALNKKLAGSKEPYLLIVMGRLGSSDPWLGIPVEWPQVSGAKAIVETTLPEMNVDFSQGSHFFHNINSLGIYYFSIHHSGNNKINWDWLQQQNVLEETPFFRHYKLNNPIQIKVDGRNRKGIIKNVTAT